MNKFIKTLVQYITKSDNSAERIKRLYKKLKLREKTIKKQQQLLQEKEQMLCSQSQSLESKEEALKEYVNKIFEQQEIDRIVRWLVNSIRESLDLDSVLSKTVEEIGKLLNVDRCLIATYDSNLNLFTLKNEYISDEKILSVFDKEHDFELPYNYFDVLINHKHPISIDDIKLLKHKGLNHFIFKDTRSVVFIAIVDNFELLGILIVNQIKYKRKWEESHIQILQDIADQIAIAIRHASLFTESQKSTRLKSEFIANMSHEFRTPLNAIIGFSEMLSSENFGALTSKQREYLNNICFSGKHLLRLVNDILDISKAESGNLELFYEIFNSKAVIQETLSVLEGMILKKNLKIELYLCDCQVRADSSKFKQILYNILSNAIKFTPEYGKIKIHSEFIDQHLKIKVEDTGIGIAEKDRDKIFVKFKQLESSYARKQDGTGLGLSLTKKLIELHNGYINFESELDKGTKFWFVLPNASLVNQDKFI